MIIKALYFLFGHLATGNKEQKEKKTTKNGKLHTIRMIIE